MASNIMKSLKLRKMLQHYNLTIVVTASASDGAGASASANTIDSCGAVAAAIEIL